MNIKDKPYLVTQLDYMKILIEEEKWGEASEIMSSLNQNLDNKISVLKNELENANLVLPKTLTKSKVNEWLCINYNWYKLKKITKNELILELNKNNIVTKSYQTIK
jgi:hypothetical protein